MFFFLTISTYTLAMVLNKLRNSGFPGEEDFCSKKLSLLSMVFQKGVSVMSVGVGNVNTLKVNEFFSFLSSSLFFFQTYILRHTSGICMYFTHGWKKVLRLYRKKKIKPLKIGRPFCRNATDQLKCMLLLFMFAI